MRVSGGELRSRDIPSPRRAGLRPTPARAKEALFSILGDRVDGARVLDLYAGTGAIGFEALSRGAAHVTFVELDAATAREIRVTAERFEVVSRAAILCDAAERAARRLTGRFDLVFADPPFAAPPPHLGLLTLRERGAVDPESVVVYEHRTNGARFEAPGFASVREATYGEVTFQFLTAEALP